MGPALAISMHENPRAADAAANATDAFRNSRLSMVFMLNPPVVRDSLESLVALSMFPAGQRRTTGICPLWEPESDIGLPRYVRFTP
jgi:hypothetical protein